LRISEDNPEAGTINIVVAGTDGSRQLSDFEASVAEHIGENAAGVIDKVAEALGDKDNVHIARRGLLEPVEIVIGEGLLEGNLDGGGRLVLVRRYTNGHGGYGCTPARSFRIGAAG
jgi:hypothetical protein